jgi:protein O-mannosyl-transferase
MVTSAVSVGSEHPRSGLREIDAPMVPRIRQQWILPALIVAVPCLIFVPTLANGFVWDDHFNLVSNRDYRGLGRAQLTWMLTSAHLAHWIPVTWLTLGFDYVVWGMNPIGYHLTNVVVHAAATGVLYFVARRLLHAAVPTTSRAALITGAAGAALFFSIHPLRAESVAWVTERRDVVSGLFFLLAVLSYLRACDIGASASRWLAISVACFQFGVLSKSIVVTLPFVLLILDVYPLRRLEPLVLRWTAPANRRVLLEKLPYVPMMALGTFVAISTFGRGGHLTSLDTLSFADRAGMIFYSAFFYVSKTVAPIALSPLYELPLTVSPLAPRFAVPLAGSLAITVVVMCLRHRWPAGLAAWLTYLCILVPVSGAVHNGRHLVADRNTYLACVPWALLFGAAIAAVVRARNTGMMTRPAFRLASIVISVWLLTLAAIASYQATIWRDDETLWRHALAVDAQCFSCRHNLGAALMANGMKHAAIEEFQRAIALRPLAPIPHGALVLGYLATGARDRAEAALRTLRPLDPDLARTLSPAFLSTW